MTFRESTSRTGLSALGLAVCWLSACAVGQTEELPKGVRVRIEAAPEAAAPGSVVEVNVKITMPDGWVAFDTVQMPGSAAPTVIRLDEVADLTPISGFAATVPMERVDALFSSRIVRYYRSSPTFRRSVYVSEDAAPGPREIRGRIDFQLCNDWTGQIHTFHHHPIKGMFTVSPRSASRETADSDGPVFRVPDPSHTPPAETLPSVVTDLAGEVPGPAPPQEPVVDSWWWPAADTLPAEPWANPVHIELGRTQLDALFENRITTRQAAGWLLGAAATILGLRLVGSLAVRDSRRRLVRRWMLLVRRPASSSTASTARRRSIRRAA